MCVYLNEIEEVVTEFTNADKMFTAWDVTMEVRKRSKDRVQHFEVKKEVHRMFDQGGMCSYNRTLANLPNINPQPWIYHPLGFDPSLYNGKPSVVTPATPVALPAPNSMTALDDGVDTAADGTTVYKFDSTDRLCVPNRLVRQLGLKNGDYVTVFCDVSPSNEVKLVSKSQNLPQGASPVADYVVDRYDNVRMGRATFAKLGISAVAFEIEGDSNEIKVKKYA